MATNLKQETRMLNLDIGGAASSGDPWMLGPLSCVLVTDTDADNMADCDFGRMLVVYDLSVEDTVGGGIAVGDVIYYDSGATPVLNNNAAGKEYGIATEAVGASATATIGVILYPGIEA